MEGWRERSTGKDGMGREEGWREWRIVVDVGGKMREKEVEKDQVEVREGTW